MYIYIYLCVLGGDDHGLHACRTATIHQSLLAFHCPSSNLLQAYIQRVPFNFNFIPVHDDYLLLCIRGNAGRCYLLAFMPLPGELEY